MVKNIQRGFFRIYTLFDILVCTPLVIMCFCGESLISQIRKDPADVIGVVVGCFILCAIPWGIHYIVKWIIKGFSDDQNEPKGRHRNYSINASSSIADESEPKETPLVYSEIAAEKGGVPFAWRRFWARTIDYSCISILTSFVLAPVIVSSYPAFQRKLIELVSKSPVNFFFLIILGSVVTIMVSIFYEALLLTLLGTTLGKSLFGMKVKALDGARLSFATAFHRSFLVHAKGLWFMLGFPFLTIWPVARSYDFVRKAHEASWDQKCGTTVFLKRICLFRAFIMSTVGCACLFAYAGLRQLAKDETQKEIRDKVAHSQLDRALARIENQLSDLAIETNKDLPKMLSADLRFDKFVSRGNRTLEYIFTCTTIDKKLVTRTSDEGSHTSAMLNTILTNPNMEPFTKNGVTFIFTYLDQNGSELASDRITPDEYKK